MAKWIRIVGVAFLMFAFLPVVEARRLGYFEQLPLETFQRLREVERYQLQVAEKAYLKGEFNSAANEYEKYLTLYESSLAAPYAQLMWSHCLVHMRQANTALRDGFQSVIDYWPDSNEAILSAYLIAKTNKDMGNVKKAEALYKGVVDDFEDHRVAFESVVDLLELAKIRRDEKTRVALLKQLVFETKLNDFNRGKISEAAKELSGISMNAGDFKSGERSLRTLFKGHELHRQVQHLAYHGARHLRRNEDTKSKAVGLADEAIAYLKEGMPDCKTDRGRAREVWLWIAGLHASVGRGEDRLKTYQEMVKQFGADDDLLNHIADWYKGAKRYDDVERIYRKFENEVRGLAAIAHLRREQGKRLEAIEMYRELIVKDKDVDKASGYLWTIADMYREMGDYSKAIQTYRQTDRIPEQYFSMAHCHRKLKQYKEALVLYNQAKSYDNQRARATLDIAFTYEEAGEREKAIRTFQATCKSFPKTGQASRAHAHLQNKYKISVTLGGATEE